MTRQMYRALKPHYGSWYKVVKTARTFCGRTKGYGAAAACGTAVLVGRQVYREVARASRQRSCWAFRYTQLPRVYFRYSYVTNTSRCRS